MGRMWTAFPVGSMALKPILSVKTVKTFDKGYAVNGLHKPNYVQVDVTLDFCKAEMTCQSCGGTIETGEIFGNGWLVGNGMHCSACLDIPNSVLVVNVMYVVKKTRNCPDGIKKVLVVHQQNVIDEYVNQLRAELKRDVQFEMIPFTVYAGVMQ